MQIACDPPRVPAIQIRNVPEQLHQELKSQADKEGLSLSDYLLRELRAVAGRPTMTAWLAEVASHEPVALTMTAAEAISAERHRQT